MNPVDEYFAGFPEDVQKKLEAVRHTIRMAAPNAEESISYRIAAFRVKGKPVVYLAGFKSHIGLYPVPNGKSPFEAELSKYAAGKGTAQFQLDEPIPFDLITKIVKFRIEENRQIAETKAATKKKNL